MEEKLIIRLSNSLGNQMFMYAAGYAAAKILNKKLYYDHISSYITQKNISKFILDNLQLAAKSANSDNLFTGFSGYIRRKIIKKIDIIKINKSFIIEKINRRKETYFDKDFLNKKYSRVAYMEGYFESEKYFLPFKKDIKKQFVPKNINIYKNNKYLSMINNSQSVALCIRQNRFAEKSGKVSKNNLNDSDTFVNEQIKYIKNAIVFFKKKLEQPIFYLWSNNSQVLPIEISSENIIHINNKDIINENDRILCDLFLMTNCKHFAVTPSSFNWWGCWLSKSENSIILRPNDNYFSKFIIKNRDYWPDNWKEI